MSYTKEVEAGRKTQAIAVLKSKEGNCLLKTAFSVFRFYHLEDYVKTIGGEYITKPGKTYKQVSYKDITFVCHNNNWQSEIIY